MKKFDYDVIIGHSLIQKKLRQAVEADRTVSAYLFCGNAGIGKKTMARAFAASLLCQSPIDGGPCHSCASCRLLTSGNHPDYLVVQIPEDKKTIGVEQVREQVIKEAYIRPFHAGRKVFVIENSEALTQEAQNALLKILEEPPAYAVFLLLSPTPDQLLQTVLSRCLKLQFLPLSNSLCRDFFSRQTAEESRKALAASFSQGNIGRGLTILNDEEYYQLYQATLAQLAAFPENRTALVDMQQFFTQNRERIDDVIDFMLIFLRDSMRQKLSKNPGLICADHKSAVERFAHAYSPGALVRTTEAVLDFRKRISKNASFSAAGLELLTKMQEEIHG